MSWLWWQLGVNSKGVCKVLKRSQPVIAVKYIGLTEVDTQAAYSEFENGV